MEDQEWSKFNGASAYYAESWEDIKPTPIQGLLNMDLADNFPCRIGISGAQGSGKYLLASRIAKKLNIPLIEHVPRTVKDMGFTLNKKSDVMAQLTIWLGQLHEQLSFYHFISDHTLIDHYAHMTWVARHTDPGLYRYLVNAIGNITAGVVDEQYSVIFYIPSTPTALMQTNGYRSTDKKYRREIDELILHFLNSFEVEYFPLPGVHNDKYKMAMDHIEGSGMLESLADDEE